jgi:hypothetical protein
MAPRNVPGQLDYAALAAMFRPSSRDALAAEARRLHGCGFTATDIAEMLSLAPGAVLSLLTERDAA